MQAHYQRFNRPMSARALMNSTREKQNRRVRPAVKCTQAENKMSAFAESRIIAGKRAPRDTGRH